LVEHFRTSPNTLRNAACDIVCTDNPANAAHNRLLALVAQGGVSELMAAKVKEKATIGTVDLEPHLRALDTLKDRMIPRSKRGSRPSSPVAPQPP
jgi:hypothetical protein